MRIDYIICPTNIEDKLASKHNVQVTEARQVLLNATRIRFAEKGHVPGDDVYGALEKKRYGRK